MYTNTYIYKVWNSEIDTEILVIADNESEAEDKLIKKCKEAGMEVDFELDDEYYYDCIIY